MDLGCVPIVFELAGFKSQRVLQTFGSDLREPSGVEQVFRTPAFPRGIIYLTTFANHGRSAGRLGQVVKCSRISLAVRLLPQPQPQGIATPGGRPPACLAFRSAWRAFCSLSDLLETCIRSRMGLSRLHCFSACESLKRPVPIQLGCAIGTRPGIASMGATFRIIRTPMPSVVLR